MASLEHLRGFFDNTREDANAYLDSFDAATAVDEDEPENIPTLVVRKRRYRNEERVISAVELYERGYTDFQELKCGSFACVYSAMTPDGSRVAIKVGEVFAYEIEAQQRAARFGIAPPIFDSFEVDVGTRDEKTNLFQLYTDDVEPTFAIVMPIMLTFDEYVKQHGLTASLFDAFEDLVERKELQNIFHGDMHGGNIVLLVDEQKSATVREMQLIDWGITQIYDQLDSDEKRSTVLVADPVVWMAKFFNRGYIQLAVVQNFVERAVRLGDNQAGLRDRVLSYTSDLTRTAMANRWVLSPQKIKLDGFDYRFRWPKNYKVRRQIDAAFAGALRDDKTNNIDDADKRYFPFASQAEAIALDDKDKQAFDNTVQI